MQPALARRIDRLSRRAHAFHRFAHHPLCEAYRPELVKVGRRTRLCRGCVYFYGGSMLGAVVGLLVGWPAGALSAVVMLACAAAAVGIGRGRRRRKWLTRALPGFSLGCALGQAGHAPVRWAMIMVAVLAAIVGLAARSYRRRGPDRSACQSCPQRDGTTTCDGFRPIVRRERAFMRVSSRWAAARSPQGPALIAPSPARPAKSR